MQNKCGGVKGRFDFFRIFIQISDSDHPQVDSDTYLNQENFAKMCFKWIQSKSLMSFGGNCMSLNLSLILPERDLTKYCEWGKGKNMIIFLTWMLYFYETPSIIHLLSSSIFPCSSVVVVCPASPQYDDDDEKTQNMPIYPV